MSGSRLSIELQKLKGKTVVVTGASGFIGNRIVQLLLAEPGITVRPMINSYHRAINLVRKPIALAKADITDYEQVRKAIDGADVVIHCAYVSKGSFNDQASKTILGTENVFKACLATGVKRAVHVSTMSVYGINTSGKLDESCPNVKSGFFYSDAKIVCEDVALKYYTEHKLPTVVIQPTIVYGPGSDSWVKSPLRAMKTGYKVLPDDGGGICNPVYVDDVAIACILAATTDKGIGERFIISGSEHLTWKDYYGYFEKMLGQPGLKLEPYEELKQKVGGKAKKVSAFTVIWQQLKKERTRNFLRQFAIFRALFAMGRALLPDALKNKIRGNVSNQIAVFVPLSKQKTEPKKPSYDPLFVYDVLRAKPIASIAKAQATLGYQPQVSLAKGMELTHKWAAWAGYLTEDEQ